MNSATLAATEPQAGAPPLAGSIAVYKGFTPGIPGGRIVFEGGPWRSLAFVTPTADWDAFRPPEAKTGSPSRLEFDAVIRLDNERDLLVFSGQTYRGIGPFKRIECIDVRNGAFIRLEWQIIVSTAPDFVFFCPEWL